MSSIKKLLWNPFRRVAGWQAFLPGIVIVTATAALGYLAHIVFIGTLQAKFVVGITLPRALTIQFISLGLGVAAMYLAGIASTRGVRFVDILGTVTLSRWPLIFAPIPAFFVSLPDPDDVVASLFDNTFSVADIAGLLLAGTIILALAVYAAILMFNAYKTSTGLKGGKLYGSFFPAYIAYEIVSALVCYSMF